MIGCVSGWVFYILASAANALTNVSAVPSHIQWFFAILSISNVCNASTPPIAIASQAKMPFINMDSQTSWYTYINIFVLNCMNSSRFRMDESTVATADCLNTNSICHCAALDGSVNRCRLGKSDNNYLVPQFFQLQFSLHFAFGICNDNIKGTRMCSSGQNALEKECSTWVMPAYVTFIISMYYFEKGIPIEMCTPPQWQTIIVTGN